MLSAIDKMVNNIDVVLGVSDFFILIRRNKGCHRIGKYKIVLEYKKLEKVRFKILKYRHVQTQIQERSLTVQVENNRYAIEKALKTISKTVFSHLEIL